MKTYVEGYGVIMAMPTPSQIRAIVMDKDPEVTTPLGVLKRILKPYGRTAPLKKAAKANVVRGVFGPYAKPKR